MSSQPLASAAAPWRHLLATLTLLAACTDPVTPATPATDAATGIGFGFDTTLATSDATSEAGPTADTDTVDTASPADTTPDTGPTCPGGEGCACASNDNCDNALCIQTPTGKACAVKCVGGCPADFTCAQVASGSDTASICVPTFGRVCDPCLATADCAAIGLTNSACTDHGAAGKFCGVACQTAAQCPKEFACLTMQSVEGTTVQQCAPKPAAGASTPGACTCSMAAAGLATTCALPAKNGAGKVTGSCKGTRSCGSAGLSACTVQAPPADTCNDLDDDCNGTVDDPGTSGCPAGVACTAGKCGAACTPVAGGWSAWQWSACSKGCGGGERQGVRTCSTPAPACGGAACEGKTTASEACNEAPCVGAGLQSGAHSVGGTVVKGAVPAGKTSILFKLWGAGGGGGAPGTGGGGAWVSGVLAVKAGDQVELRVGSGGAKSGGGGGASYVYLNGSVVLVAAGGGGGGSDGNSGNDKVGQTAAGGGGGAVGGTGQAGMADNAYQTNSGGGAGGTQTAGGAAGISNNQSVYKTCTVNGKAGAANAGGATVQAVNDACSASTATPAKFEIGSPNGIGNGAGGAGGSGWFGGGSGASMWTYTGGGGGGGASWAAATGISSLDSQAGTFKAAGGQSAPGYAGDAGGGGGAQTKSFGAPAQPGRDGLVIVSL